MSDYVPIIKGTAATHTTSAAVTGGTLLSVSGDGTVATAAANDKGWVGVAAFDAAATGLRVTVESGGIQLLTASGSITAGDEVVCATGGKVSTLAAVTTPTAADVTNTRAIVGIALTTAADTASVRVLMAH